MKKSRKGSFLQRMLAVLLAAVLTAGMVSNAVPASVLAQEGNVSENISENDGELTGEETEPVETPKPEAGAGQETPKPDAVAEQKTPKPDAGTGQETPKPDAGTGTEEETEQENISEETVADEENGNLQALLERIAALPDAAEYLAAEPDVNSGAADEDAYIQWMSELYAYAQEALAIQEEIEKLTEEQRAQISEAEMQKLAAWAATAQTAEESTQVMTTETTSGTCGDNVKWTLANNVLTISGTGEMKNYNAGSGIPWFDNGTYTNIVKVVIEDGVKSIGNNAFYGCSSLTSVSIADTVEKIGDGAFSTCQKLEEIIIPQSITSIGGSAFMNCSNLQKVTILSEDPPVCGTSIFFYSNNAKFYVPVCDYLVADTWANYKFKTVPTTHTGDISYSASGSKITQKCGTCDTEYGTATLSLSGTNFTYTGTAITPVSVTYANSGTNAWSGEKPTAITYENNINAGTATATLTLRTGETATTARLSFKIQSKALTDDMVTLPSDSFPHTGNAVTPEVTVRDGGKLLTKDTDYTVSYTSNSAVGTAVVTVTGTGNYSGTVEKNFQIVKSDADKVAAAKTVVENVLAGFTATNDTTQASIQDVINTALSDAGITDVIVEIDKFQKSEATTSAAGYINGVISIRCGAKSETINGMGINGGPKPIAQLEAGKYVVAVNSGTGSGNYEAGVTVRITANTPASGQQFDQWVVNSGNVTLDSATSVATTFIMPAEAVSVTATYKTNPGGGSGGDHSGGSGDSGSGNNNNDNGGSNNNNDSGSGNTGGNNNDGSGNSGSSAGNSVSNVGSGSSVTNTPVEIPEIRIITSQEELEDALLAETEKQQKAGGADIRIELDVDVVTAEASVADRALVEEALHGSAAGYTVGQYLDIRLYKVMGDSRTAIRETDGKLTIRIDVPDSLKNTDNSRTRTFAVIRVHEGRTEFLADLDNDADTITIETDRFSTYAVVFKDEAAGSAKPNSGKDAEPKTGDTTPLELYATLSMIAGFTYLLVYFSDRKRGMTEEIKRELVSRLVGWAKQGGKLRKCLALAAIFVLLVYYHSTRKLYRSIGKKTCVEWREIYGK